MAAVFDEAYVERVLACVERVPVGRVTTYGAVGDAVGSGPRLVGRALALHGAPVPWWRVVRADGSLPPSHGGQAARAYAVEGTPLRGSGRVDLVAAFWDPVPGDQSGGGAEGERDSGGSPPEVSVGSGEVAP